MKLFIHRGLLALVVLGMFLAPVFSLRPSMEISLVSTVYAQATSTDPGIPDTATNDDEDNTCLGWSGIHPTLSIGNCVAWYIKVAFMWPAWLVASLAGMMADTLLHVSVSSRTYSQSAGFVVEGWKVVRDLANIFFIFTLLVIAIGTMLGIEKISPKKLLARVLIIALFINFSLFITRIVIDAGNILSRAFINSMDVQVTDPVTGETVERPYIEFSTAIMSKLKPNQITKLVDEAIPQPTSYGGGEWKAVKKIVLYLGVTVICGLLIYTFLVVAVMFLVRIIGLWMVMILAPIAFISHALPFSLPDKMNHSKWWKELFNLSFQAPVFLFFMYLIVLFLDSNFIGSAVYIGPDASMIEQLLAIFIPLMVLIGLVFAAKKVTVQMSGDIGGKIAGLVDGIAKMAATLAAAAATGGTSFIAARGLGAVGSRIAQSEWLKGIGSGEKSNAFGALGKWTADKVLIGGEKLSTSSFDWRNTHAGENIMKATGFSQLGLREGGYTGARERYVEAEQKKAERYEVGHDEEAMHHLHESEEKVERFKSENKDTIEKFDKDIEKKRQQYQDSTGPDKETASVILKNAIANYDQFKKGNTYKKVEDDGSLGATQTAATIDGHGLKTLEHHVHEAGNNIISINNKRREGLAHDIEHSYIAAGERAAATIAGALAGSTASIITHGIAPALSIITGKKITKELLGLTGTRAGYVGQRNIQREAAHSVRSGKKEEKKEKKDKHH